MIQDRVMAVLSHKKQPAIGLNDTSALSLLLFSQPSQQIHADTNPERKTVSREPAFLCRYSFRAYKSLVMQADCRL